MRKPEKDTSDDVFAYFALALFVIFFAVILQSWLASHMTIWGDESDTMAPAFRVWRGDHDFLWQIGQYNANPPGDNLQLRWYYRSGVLVWLKELAESLYWRLPYILVYAATCVAAFIGAFRWTRSGLLALFACLYIAVTGNVFDIALSARFYIWEVFFVTAAVFQALYVLETPFHESKQLSGRFVALSLIASLGICFHLMLVPIGYLILVYAYFCLVLKIYRHLKTREFNLKDGLSCFFLLLVGYLPFIIYKVELKHWIFVPPPWKEINPLARLMAAPLSLFVDRITISQPYMQFWRDGGLLALIAIIVLGFVASGYKKIWAYFTQLGFAIIMICGTIAALFYSASARNYPLTVNHGIYQSPVFAATLVLLLKIFRDEIFKIRSKKIDAFFKGVTGRVTQYLAAIFIFITALGLIGEKAGSIRHFSLFKSNYSFSEWRDYYRRVPDKKTLYVFGANPREMLADDDGYTAGMLDIYVKEFSPFYVSERGCVDPSGNKVNFDFENAKFEAGTDILVVACDWFKKRHSKFKWENTSCFKYPDQQLCHCRVLK